MRLTIAYSKIKKRNLVLINNTTYQRETLSERPIRQPLKVHIVLHVPLSGLFALAWRKCLENYLKYWTNGAQTFLFVLLELWFVYHFPRFLQFSTLAHKVNELKKGVKMA